MPLTVTPSQRLFRSYYLLLTGTALFFVFVVAGLSLLQYLAFRRDALNIAQERVLERTTLFEGALKATTNHVDRMKRWGELFLDESADGAEPEQLRERTAAYAGDEAVLLETSGLFDKVGPGCLLAQGPLAGRDDHFYHELDMALHLLDVQRVSHAVSPCLAWSYYQSKERFITLFPQPGAEDKAGHGTPTDLRDVIERQYVKERWTNGLPENNPGQSPFWTGVYSDVLGKGLMLTRVAPVYDEGRFLGVVAADVTLHFLQRYVQARSYPHSLLMVINDRRQVLACSGYVPTENDAPSLYHAILPKALRGTPAALMGERVPSRRSIKGYHVFMKPVANAPWHLAYIIPETDLIHEFLPRYAVFLTFVLGFALAMIGFRLHVMRQFLRPALALVNHIHAEAVSGPKPIPKVPRMWVEWFEKVSNTFALRAVTANLPGVVYQFELGEDGQMRLPFISAGVADFVGVSAEELMSRDRYNLEFIAPDDRPRLLAAAQESARSMTPVDFECRLDSSLSTEKWVRFLSRPRRGAAGQILWEGIALDVTERIRAQAALRESEERYRTLFESAHDAIFLMKGMYFVDCNPQTVRLFGYTREEICSLSPVQVSPEYQPNGIASAEWAAEKTGLAYEGQPQFFEWQHRKADGALFDVEVALNRLDIAGEPHLLAVVRDVTTRKRTEEERERLINDLEKALTEVKTLSGLLPICARCKKIRDDKGYWNRLETYIMAHSNADFTHGLCPECFRDLYPEFCKDDGVTEEHRNGHETPPHDTPEADDVD